MSNVSATTTEAEPIADCSQQSSLQSSSALQCPFTVFGVQPLAVPALTQEGAAAMVFLSTMDGSL